MKKNPKSSQNLLVTIGIEKSTLPVAERIARENLHYALLVFIPVFVAAVFLLFRYSSLPVWIGFGLQLITGALLVMRLQMYKKNNEHVLAANEAIYWHVFTSLIYFVLCASKASRKRSARAVGVFTDACATISAMCTSLSWPMAVTTGTGLVAMATAS